MKTMNLRLIALFIFFSTYGFSNPCDSLQILSENKQLTISNISAPNTIAKVFDANWQIINNCTGDCPETITIPDLIAGKTYHTDVQFYDKNWSFICKNKQDILIEGGEESCDISICAGNIILRTQEQIDTFCKCEIIEGRLFIYGYELFQLSNITNLKPLRTLKEVKGEVTIINTHLENLDDLKNLKRIGGKLNFSNNYKLKTLKGFDSLVSINSLVISENPILEDIGGIPNLTNIEGGISIFENPRLNSLTLFNQFSELNNIRINKNSSLIDLKEFSNIKSVNLFEIEGNANLKTLNGLENLIEVNGSLVVTKNDSLKSINSLKKLSMISDGISLSGKSLTSLAGLKNLHKVKRLIIFENPVLTNCCDIVHLLDSDTSNGFKPDFIRFYDNPAFCNSPEEILVNCLSPSSPCENVHVNIENNQISIANITSPNEVIKIFDKDYNLVYECSSNCEMQQAIDFIKEESYLLDVQLYNENWELICSEQFPLQLNNLPCESNDCETVPPILSNIPNDLTVECQEIPPLSGAVFATDNCDNSVEIIVDEVITEETCTGNYKLNRIWTAKDDCGNTTNARQIITVQDNTAPVLENIPLDLTLSSSNNIPEITTPVRATDNCDNDLRITGGSGRGLLGGDTIITRSWSVRDDCGNRATASQIIIIKQGQSNCENIQISRTDSTITVSNIDAPNAILKVFDTNWQIIFDCAANCESQLIIPIEGKGIYHTDIQFYDENWGFICEDKQDIEEGAMINPCVATCQGGVTLISQAEVDAFCGCEKIDGDILIGKEGSDISNLNNLSGLKEVTGSIYMTASNITDLTGLDSLEKIGGTFNVNNGDSLRSLKGLNKLVFIGGALRIAGTHFLKNLDELSNLQKLGNFVLDYNRSLENLAGLHQIDTLSGITIFGNEKIYNLDELENLTHLSGIYFSATNITNLKFFSKVKDAQPFIYIGANDTLMSLEGLEHFDTLGSLTLGANDKLNDVSAIKNAQYIKKDLILEFNKQLGNCCIIQHLLSGGRRVGGRISLGGNKRGSSCQDVIQLSRCPTAPVSPCENISTIAVVEYIGIGGLTAPIEIVKVFDANYNIVYECFGDCEENIQIRDLPVGTYHININFYDENWQPMCEYNKSIEFIGNALDRNVDFVATDFSIYPNPAQDITYIDLHKIKGKEAKLTLINQFGQEVWQKVIPKVGDEKERIALNMISNGVYFLQIQTSARKSIAKKLIVNRLY